MNTSHVVQYRHKGRWLNYYLMADSIDDAERRARAWGIYGTGFELVEAVVFDKRDPWWVRFGKWMLAKCGR